MEILVTNDDGYTAKGIRVLTEIMSGFGHVTVIAPKRHQSGMSMAISIGMKPIAYKKVSHSDNVDIAYIDATPTSCVKFAFNTIYLNEKPDVVVSGINHGSNASSASCYSGTLGAVEEAALLGIPGIGVSLDTVNPDADFSAVRKYFPDIFRKLTESLPQKYGVYYNVNFPAIPAEEIRGIRAARQGKGTWIKEFVPWEPEKYCRFGMTPESFGVSRDIRKEDGEEIFMMTGQFSDSPDNPENADHRLVKSGYISISAHNIDTTDYEEVSRLEKLGFNINY